MTKTKFIKKWLKEKNPYFFDSTNTEEMESDLNKVIKSEIRKKSKTKQDVSNEIGTNGKILKTRSR